MNENNSEKLKLSAKIGFAMGDIYGGGAIVIVNFYYMIFLTDVLRINPLYAGIVIFISKAWDAVSDPIMGYISDRTNTKYGRRRPYFIFGIPLIFLSFFLMWYPVGFTAEFSRVLYVLFSYMFFSTVITFVMVPYNALAAELTLDYNERTNLTSFRIAFSTISSLICAVGPIEIVKAFESDERTGYIIMGIVIGLFFALPYFMTFFTTKERIDFQKKQASINIIKIYTEPFKIPTFIQVLGMYLFAFVAMDVVSAMFMYFMTYYIGMGGEANYVIGTLLFAQIVSLPFYYRLSKKTSKKNAYISAAVFLIFTMFLSLFLTPDLPRALLFIYASIIGGGTGGIVIMVFSIFTDVPDVDELYSGQRREGMFSGVFTFLRKMSSAIAFVLLGFIMDVAGYRKPVIERIDDITRKIPQEQSDEFLLILRIFFVSIPVVFIIFAVLFARKYTLVPKLHVRLKSYLDKIRENPDAKNQFVEEELSLKKELEGKQ